MAALAVALEAGLMLAALYVLTGRLWASIGAHIAWNFTQGYVFGARVSGVDLGPSLYRAEPVAGAGTFWTGGPFGPEASWPAVLLGMPVAAAAILALAARRARGTMSFATGPTCGSMRSPQAYWTTGQSAGDASTAFWTSSSHRIALGGISDFRDPRPSNEIGRPVTIGLQPCPSSADYKNLGVGSSNLSGAPTILTTYAERAVLDRKLRRCLERRTFCPDGGSRPSLSVCALATIGLP